MKTSLEKYFTLFRHFKVVLLECCTMNLTNFSLNETTKTELGTKVIEKFCIKSISLSKLRFIFFKTGYLTICIVTKFEIFCLIGTTNFSKYIQYDIC